MSTDVRCGNSEALASYLYDEGDPGERLAMATHLASCTSCVDEIAALQATRVQISGWTPPEARLGFRIVGDASEAGGRPFLNPKSQIPNPKPWWPWAGVPAWAQMAAAVMLLTSGVALANLHVSYRDGAVTVRIGRQLAMASASGNAVSENAMTGTLSPASAQDLALLEQRLRQEFARTTASGTTTIAGDARHDADVLARVRELIAASEQRQQGELSLRLAQAVRDVDLQRRADIARLERAVVEVEGTTGAEVLQQRQMLDYLMKVSQQAR